MGALVAAAAYLLLPGLLFAELAGRAPTPELRTAWRLGAWILSLVVFLAHFGYERMCRRRPARTAARHVALGVALGASGLAAAALVRALVTRTGKPALLAIALLAWPAILAPPAFLAAWALGAMLRPRESRGVDGRAMS